MEWQPNYPGEHFKVPGALLVVQPHRSGTHSPSRFETHVIVRDGRSEHAGITYHDDEATAKEHGLERLHAALFDVKAHRQEAVRAAEAAVEEAVQAIDALQRAEAA